MVKTFALLMMLSQAPDLGVRIATPDQRKMCQYLGLVSAHAGMGRNKSANALRKAFEKVGALHGNGLFIVSQSENALEGASLSGEALNCPN